MRRFLQTLSVVAVLCLPLAAHADSLDLITINGGSYGTFTLTVPSTPTAFTADTSLGAIILNNIPVTGPGFSGNDTVYFYTTTYGGGLLDLNPAVAPLNLIGPSLFNDTLTAPAFLLGSGTLTFYIPPSFTSTATFSYSVTSLSSTPAVPEPASLWLLGSGALGIVGSLRRRILASI